MVINFPKEEEVLSPEDANIVYNQLVDYHLYFLKQQSKCEFFYWKLAGFFFLSIMGAFILQDKGIIMDPLIAITIVGFGCLMIFAQNVKSDMEYAVEIASCTKIGLAIEEKYNYLARLFRIFEENKKLRFKANLLSRSIPFTFIGLATLLAGPILASTIGIWLSVIVGLSVLVSIIAYARFYLRTLRKIILGSLAL